MDEKSYQISISLMDYQAMKRKTKGHPDRRYPKKAYKKTRPRLVDPKDFCQVYDHPLAAFMPLVEYLSGVRVEEAEEREQREDNRRRHEEEQCMFHPKFDRARSSDREKDVDQDEKILKGQQELAILVKKQPDRTFQRIKEDIVRQFDSYRLSMDKNRKGNVDFIEGTLSVSLKAYDLLNKDKLAHNWARIQVLIKNKLAIATQNFQQKQPLLDKIRQLDPYLDTTKKSKQKIKPLKQLTPSQQGSLFKMIILYLSLPTSEHFHLQISTFQRKSRQIFKKFGDQEDQLKRVLRNLPYKESSYLWSKILQCCRYISDCDHYRDLDDRRVDTFEAEYAGIITHDILKRLRENEWLDNSITSAVIEYLKQVEGTNNYHNDSNFRACLFTHSETDIFVNNQRDTNNWLAYERLIFLVNIPNQHWFIIAVYMSSAEIVVYDSLGTYPDAYSDYCQKIEKKLKRKRPETQFKRLDYYTPKQINASDCGVFSIINIICALDKQPKAQRKNNFNPAIVPQIRYSLFLFLLYLGYCKRFQAVPRKDYFDILFRTTIHSQLRSKLHEDKRKGR